MKFKESYKVYDLAQDLRIEVHEDNFILVSTRSMYEAQRFLLDSEDLTAIAEFAMQEKE